MKEKIIIYTLNVENYVRENHNERENHNIYTYTMRVKIATFEIWKYGKL